MVEISSLSLETIHSLMYTCTLTAAGFAMERAEVEEGCSYLAIDPYTEVSISNAIFDNNAANQAGGAIYMTISVKQKALSLRIILQAMQQQKVCNNDLSNDRGENT